MIDIDDDDNDQYDGNHLRDLVGNTEDSTVIQFTWKILNAVNDLWFEKIPLFMRMQKDVIFPTNLKAGFFARRDEKALLDELAEKATFNYFSSISIKEYLKEKVIPLKFDFLRCRFLYIALTFTNFDEIEYSEEENDTKMLQYYLYKIKCGIYSKPQFFAKLCR